MVWTDLQSSDLVIDQDVVDQKSRAIVGRELSCQFLGFGTIRSDPVGRQPFGFPKLGPRP
jgi:hypothetical protein